MRMYAPNVWDRHQYDHGLTAIRDIKLTMAAAQEVLDAERRRTDLKPLVWEEEFGGLGAQDGPLQYEVRPVEVDLEPIRERMLGAAKTSLETRYAWEGAARLLRGDWRE